MDSLWMALLPARFLPGSAVATSNDDPIKYVLRHRLIYWSNQPRTCMAAGFFFWSKFANNKGMKVYETRTFTTCEQYITTFLKESIPLITMSMPLKGIDRIIRFMLSLVRSKSVNIHNHEPAPFSLGYPTGEVNPLNKERGQLWATNILSK
jgi:hypothetical protein